MAEIFRITVHHDGVPMKDYPRLYERKDPKHAVPGLGAVRRWAREVNEHYAEYGSYYGIAGPVEVKVELLQGDWSDYAV